MRATDDHVVLVDLTYNSKEINKRIDAAVGSAFGLFSKMRWQGIGSERLVITNATGQLYELFGGKFSQHFANIELRPKGIIVRIRYRLEVYGVIFPYNQMTLIRIGNDQELIVERPDIQITLRNYQGRSMNPQFIQKMINKSSLN